MAYPSASIANAFLDRAYRDRRPIDPMKMQKLCYLAHGYSLITHEQPLFDEKFEAWKFGPVLPNLYHLLKGYKFRSVARKIKDYDYETRREIDAPPPNDPAITEILDFVWNQYGGMDAVDLSDWTHERDGPWNQVVSTQKEFVRNMSIPDSLIADYFMRNMTADAAQAA
jgi:uncharacterized phage-associated protein